MTADGGLPWGLSSPGSWLTPWGGTAIWSAAVLTALSGMVVAVRMYETHRRGDRQSDAEGAAALGEEMSDI